MSEDVSIALREYAHYALLNSAGVAGFPQTEIESAIADYLAASFLGSPVIGSNLGRLFGLKTKFIRTLDNPLRYASLPTDDWYGHGQVWAAALWACRQQEAQLDELMLPAWRAATAGMLTDPEHRKRFAGALIAAPAPAGPCLSKEFERRGLPR
jgi:hypothetical protein